MRFVSASQGWILTSVLAVAGCSLDPPPATKEVSVRYQGEKFVVVQPESNFDASDTRKFVRPEDAEQIEQLLLAAPIEKHYASLPDIMAAVSTIQFPDYGRTVLEQRGTDASKKIYVIAVEVPRRHKDRYFTFYGDDTHGYDLVDEFVLEAKALPKPPESAPEEEPPYEQKIISTVRTDGKKFSYLDPLGVKVREK